MPTELDINRNLTKWFIDCDPSTITLIPRVKTIKPGGGSDYSNGTPRNPQQFKMIFQSGDSTGVVVSDSGEVKKYDFIILGKHDAQIEIGDIWYEGSGENRHKYIVVGFTPFNNYEIKAGVTSFGKRPGNG